MNPAIKTLLFYCFRPIHHDYNTFRFIQHLLIFEDHPIAATALFLAAMIPMLDVNGGRDGSGGIEEILQEVEGNGIMALTRKAESGMERRTENQGEFAHLQIPMQKRAVEEMCREHGISLAGISVHIQRDPELLQMDIAGSAAPERIGRIDLFPYAFKDEEQLLRTVIHEGAHVKQLRKYGKEYVQNNRLLMEAVARRYENFFYRIAKRRRLK